MRTRRLLSGAIAVLALAVPATAFGHAERVTDFPPGGGDVPKWRASGPDRIVCAPDSAATIRRLHGAQRRKNRRLLQRCAYHSIQSAIDASQNYDRIRIVPGIYREEASRAAPYPDPRCAGMMVKARSKEVMVPSYDYELNCPNARNLIAIVGDTDGDRRCDRHCHLQIQGTGPSPRWVTIEGDRHKNNVIKVDRGDGVYLDNFTIQYSDFNNIYVLETDGFVFNHIVSRWSREYGFLTFTSDHGIYENLDTYGAGDSGVYPGSGPQTHGARCGIVIRNVDSHGNLQGNAGAAGDGLCYEHNRFHDNAVGIVVDSFSAGHPGMPQNNSRWTDNQIYSNNQDFFSSERDAYCKKPPLERDPKIVCPAIMIPEGTGLLIAGGNENVISANRIWDNWRNGTMQFFVEAHFRGVDDPTKQQDTSFTNRYVDNVMGVAPDGSAAPNGKDFWWDEEGAGNCWSHNTGRGGAPATGDPAKLPDCPGSTIFTPVNPVKHAFLVPCATWDAQDNTDPPGCDWLAVPPKPGSGAARAAAADVRTARVTSTARRGPVAWAGTPFVRTPPSLPHDRVLTGRIVNRGTRTVSLGAPRVRVLDAHGRLLRTATGFLDGFTGTNIPFNRGPRRVFTHELYRSGRLVTLRPGRSAAITLSWREPAGRPGARVRMPGAGWLSLAAR